MAALVNGHTRSDAMDDSQSGLERPHCGHVETVREERVDELGRKVVVTRKILKKQVISSVPAAIAARRVPRNECKHIQNTPMHVLECAHVHVCFGG